MTSVAGIEALARRIGELRAAELAIFAALGTWALDAGAAPAQRVAFTAAGHRAAWRAQQLAGRAPVLAALPPDDAIAFGDDGLGAAAAALAATAHADRAKAAASIVRVLAVAYDAARSDLSPTDAPSARLFARLAHDAGLPS
jgi:hypothetical protein